MCSHLFRSKRVGPLLSGLAFAILVAGSATAADFSRRSAKHSDAEFKRFVAERQPVPATSARRSILGGKSAAGRARVEGEAGKALVF
jgi:hypothetical protein